VPAESSKSALRPIVRGVRWAILVAAVIVILLMLKKPVRPPQPDPAFSSGFAREFDAKVAQLAGAHDRAAISDQVRFSSGEVNAAVAESLADPRVNPAPADTSVQTAKIKDMRVAFEDDVVIGSFQTEIYGKDVYVTVSGRLGAQDGYATFQPTGFKVGDLSVPVSLVEPALQRKLADAENREKLKLPEFVSELRVEKGELVVVTK
jgi:hypothetical protein